jgi:hypothetical protein
MGPGGAPGMTGPTGPEGSKMAILTIQNEPRGLFCMEMPEARFEDVLTFTLDGTWTEIDIDPLFIESCEVGSILAVSLVSNKWAPLGAFVEDDKLYVHHKEDSEIEEEVFVTVKLSGIRRGMTERFPVFNARQMEANNKFWSSSYE